MTGITRAYIDQLRRERSDRRNVRRDQFVIATGWLDLLLNAADRSLTEQSRIDAAVAKERERLIAVVRQRRDLADRQHESVRALRNYSDAAYYASKVEALSGALADMTTPPR